MGDRIKLRLTDKEVIIAITISIVMRVINQIKLNLKPKVKEATIVMIKLLIHHQTNLKITM